MLASGTGFYSSGVGTALLITTLVVFIIFFAILHFRRRL
jgi:hypothetical protein